MNFYIGVLRSPLSFRFFSARQSYTGVWLYCNYLSRELTVKYQSSTVGRSSCCRTELHDARTVVDTKEYLVNSSIIFTWLKSTFTRLHLLKFLCISDPLPRRYRRKDKWLFLLRHRLECVRCVCSYFGLVTFCPRGIIII